MQQHSDGKFSMLKIYEWEHKQFQELYNIYLLPARRYYIINKLADHFGIHLNWLHFTSQSWGYAYVSSAGIKLPKRPSSLGLAIHELAHLYTFQKTGQHGHRKDFKKSLIKLMVETKYALPGVLNGTH
jgi:hypothetical protein